MDKMVKRGLALSIFIILGILILMRYNNSYIKVEESIEISETIKKGILDKEYINIDEIVIEEWDQLLIIGPYTERKEAENESSIRLNLIKNYNMDINDGANLLVFCSDGRVSEYVYLPRYIADIDLNSFKDNSQTRTVLLPRNQTKFKVVKANEILMLKKYSN